MALADVEGAHICLKELTITHQMASWESIQEILLKHYSRQFLHEMYKVVDLACVPEMISHHVCYNFSLKEIIGHQLISCITF